MGTRLLADVGGTNTRCALQRRGDPPGRIRRYRNDDFPDLESVLWESDPTASPPPPPPQAATASAAPADREPLVLTNRRWEVSRGSLCRRLGLDSVHIMNDYAAIALSLPRLGRDETVPVGPDLPPAAATRAVLGPGTGLGMAGLLWHESRWIPVPGEGGHVTMPACDRAEAALLERLRTRHGGHVSAERVLSGPGLAALHEAVAAGSGATTGAVTPEEVCRRAAAGDEIASRTLDTWFAMLGTVTGDLALWLGARGGVYLAGGILPQLAGTLAASRFRERFEAKGRYREYLARIPTRLITAPLPALTGLAAWLDGADHAA